jgi:ribonuclease D
MLNELDPIWVDDPAGVREAAAAVRSSGWLALDTEADSLHSYFHKTCLVQLTVDRGSFVIDPLALDCSDLEALWQLVGDPALPVLMHGADYDIRVLDRDYGTRVRGLIDTQIMAQILGEPKTGLAALLGKELGVELDKRHQRADWGRRPLTPSQIVYAAADTAFLEALTQKLRARLEGLGRWEWAVEDFRRLEEVRHRPVEPDPRAFEKVKGVRALRGSARDRAYSLYEWREREARRLDVPPFKVLGNKTLVALAEQPPRSPSELAAMNGIGPRFVRRWGRAVLRLLGGPKPAPQWQRSPRKAEATPAVVRRAKKLASSRDAVASELGIEPGLLCAKSCVLAVAAHDPPCTDAAELESTGLRGWRLGVLAEPFLEVLSGN